MGEIILSFLAEEALGLAFTASKNVVTYLIDVFSSAAYRELSETLNRLKPIIDEMYKLSLESSSDTWPRSIHIFQGQLAIGLELVEECERTRRREIGKKISQKKKIQKLGIEISKFMKDVLLPIMGLNVIKLANNSNQLLKDQKDIGSKIDAITQEIGSFSMEIGLLLNQIIEKLDANLEQHERSPFVPNAPSFLVGFDNTLIKLKDLLLGNTVSVVGVTGMCGMGKSTLASALCHHDQIKGYFKKRIVYITVSKSPNIQDILEDMWENIVGGQKPGFKNVDETHDKLQRQIQDSRRDQPTLVILDDVCSMSDLEKLLFEGEQYKTLVTTRYEKIIRNRPNALLYPLPLLQEEHALSLFCHCAFGEPTIPSTHDTELVEQIQAECKGLPLALQVIGSSLRGEPSPVWIIAKNKLSRGEAISPYHEENLLKHLKTTSIDVLNEVAKQCFLDLAAFPKGRTISTNALLDIWVYVRGMDWDDAFMVLWEFADRNLLELKRDPRSAGITYGCVNGLSFSQHGALRDLALYLVKENNMNDCARLYMPKKHYDIPSKSQTVQPSKAQIVFIHTGGGAVDDREWSQMEFPEAEALVLFFTASVYCIPSFLQTMKKLKVLIIHNCSARRGKLNGLDGFVALSQLKSLQLEKMIVPPMYDYLKFLESLEKLSLSLCEGLGNMSELGRDKLKEEDFWVKLCKRFLKIFYTILPRNLRLSLYGLWKHRLPLRDELFRFPGLLEINMDHCSDLEELPTGICSLTSLKKLSVTNCHGLKQLPDELGKLGLLELLRLCASASLTALPASIRSLQQLEFLDISLCGCLEGFPEEFHELARLKKLDMRECSKLKDFRQTLSKLPSLKHVICDPRNEKQLKSICKAGSTTELTVEVVEEAFNLDWLYD